MFLSFYALVEFSKVNADAILQFLRLVTLPRNTSTLRHHHHAGAPSCRIVYFTLRIGPRSICWTSLLTVSSSGIETRRGVVRIHCVIWSHTAQGFFSSRQTASDGFSCRSPQTSPCQQTLAWYGREFNTLAYLATASSDSQGHRCPLHHGVSSRHSATTFAWGLQTVRVSAQNVVVDSHSFL